MRERMRNLASGPKRRHKHMEVPVLPGLASTMSDTSRVCEAEPGFDMRLTRVARRPPGSTYPYVPFSTVHGVSHRWPTVWTHHVYRTEGGCYVLPTYRTECWSYCIEGGRATVHIFTYGESVLSRGDTLYSVLISLKGPLDLLVGPVVLVVCSALAVRCLGLAVRR